MENLSSGAIVSLDKEEPERVLSIIMVVLLTVALVLTALCS